MKEPETITVGRLADAVTNSSGIRCTPRMIHNYESKGLIARPERSKGGIRLYPAECDQRIALIKRLQRDYNLSLTAIRLLLEQPAGDAVPDGARALLRGAEPATARGRRGDESRRDSLLLAADRVLRAKGYRETTIEDIAREAGVAKGTFYLYFESKERLFLEVLEKAVRALEEHLEQALNGVSGPVDRLEKRALSYMRGYLKYRDLIHILYGEAVGGNTRFQREFRRIYEKITSTLKDDVSRATASLGDLHLDPELLSYALVGAGEMLAYRVSLDDRYDLEDIVKSAVGLLRQGQGGR